MFWTHLYDLLGKLVSLAISVGLLIVVATSVQDRQALPVFYFVLCFVPGVLIWWFWMRPLSSWCYAFFSLGVRLSWREAKDVSVLFSPLRQLHTWYPLKECRSRPIEERAEFVIHRAESLREKYRKTDAVWKTSPLVVRIARVSLWAVMLGCGFAAAVNIPPFDVLARVQAALFGGSYWPLVSALVAMTPAGIALGALEKRIGTRTIIIRRSSEGDTNLEDAESKP